VNDASAGGSGPGPESGVRGELAAYVSLALLATIWALATWTTVPSEPAELEPDVDRAFALVERIAAEPHRSGTPENDAVRELLAAELQALGLEVERRPVLVPMSPRAWMPWLEEAAEAGELERGDDGRPLVPIESLVARVRGTGGDGAGAVLLQAHFDSRAGAPGAGDDAAGVAAVLEALRLVLGEGPFERDLIVHLDDGEELGLLGARNFADTDPWRSDVRCVLNFDARGNAGAPIAFELGPGSAPLLRAAAERLPNLVAPSLATAVYKRLPNDTSFTPFKEQGLPGVNVAFVGGASAYHQPWDTAANLSRATLARTCEVAAGLTLAALAVDADELERGGDVVSFNALAGRIVIYPEGWSLPLLAPPLVLLVVALLRARRAERSLVRGAGVALVLAVLAFGGAVLAWWFARALAGALTDADAAEPVGNLTSAMLGGLGALGVGIALAGALLGRLSAQVASEAALAGAAACSLLMLALFVALPEGAYLLEWPLVCALAPAAFQAPAHRGLATHVLGLVGFALAASILAPTFGLLLQVVSIHPPRVALLAGGFAVLVALPFADVLHRATRSRARRATPSTGIALAASFAVTAGAFAAASGS